RDILHHLAVAPAADLAGNGKGVKAVRQDDDVCRLDCDISTASHGDPNIGLHERWRVVDAVADHRDPAIALQPPHDSRFVLRQYASMHLIDPGPASSPSCGALVVTGHEDCL